MKQARLIIQMSLNGRDGWTNLEPHTVPAWVQEPRIMGRMVAGEMCMDPRSPSGAVWFRAVRVVSAGERDTLLAAQEKRDRKALRAHG